MLQIDKHHKDFDTYSPKWKRCRDAMAGQDAVHTAQEAYLPKLKDQDPLDYASYVKRAGFYNATWRTVSGLLGMMFRKPPKIEMPAQMESYAFDIDMAGTSLDTFARKTALEILGVGRVGIMVDHPAAEVQAMSVKVAEEQGLRPMLKIYKCETIINWKYERIRNYWMLSQVRLEETVEEPDGEFAVKEVKQWRVLDLDESGNYRQRVYRKVDGKGEFEQIGGDIYPLMGGKPLDFIPFYIVGTDGVDSQLDEPPLIDLIDVNLAHYRTNADYEHGCHFTGLPTLFLSGISPTETGMPSFYIGSEKAILAPDPNAKGMFIEFTGQGLGALRDNLDHKEQQMAVLGARMLFAEKRAVEAAETASIHRAGENSVLASLAQAVSEALEKALTVFAKWSGTPAEIVYQLNRDYNPAMLDAPQLTALLKTVQAGEMSSEEFFVLLQRADIIDSEKSFEEHQEQVVVAEPVRPTNDPAQELAA